MITQSELKELLHYEPKTGVFTWLVSHQRIRVGDVAGGNVCQDYTRIQINGVRYKAHRLAWLYVHGSFPPHEIDHRNQTKSDNRWRNLRLATSSENKRNVGINSRNTSGFKGVSWNKTAKKWEAYGRLNGGNKNLGGFDSAELASAAYQAFAKRHHGAFYSSVAP